MGDNTYNEIFTIQTMHYVLKLVNIRKRWHRERVGRFSSERNYNALGSQMLDSEFLHVFVVANRVTMLECIIQDKGEQAISML